MVPYYKMEDELAVHYWDRNGWHLLICKDQRCGNCSACRRNGAYDCLYLELGEMTKWPWDVHKLTLAEQAEALLLYPGMESERGWFKTEMAGEDDWDTFQRRMMEEEEDEDG